MFFVSDAQQEIITKAISIAKQTNAENFSHEPCLPATTDEPAGRDTKAQRKKYLNKSSCLGDFVAKENNAEKRAAALTKIASKFIERHKTELRIRK